MIKNFYFFVFIYKRIQYGYKNYNVRQLVIQKTGEIWATMKDLEKGMGIKNIFDLVSK